MKKEQVTVEQLYTIGELTLDELGKVRRLFNITCVKCNSADIAIKVEGDDDGYCETCSSPYARATIKCKDCGNAVSIRD